MNTKQKVLSIRRLNESPITRLNGLLNLVFVLFPEQLQNVADSF